MDRNGPQWTSKGPYRTTIDVWTVFGWRHTKSKIEKIEKYQKMTPLLDNGLLFSNNGKMKKKIKIFFWSNSDKYLVLFDLWPFFKKNSRLGPYSHFLTKNEGNYLMKKKMKKGDPHGSPFLMAMPLDEKREPHGSPFSSPYLVIFTRKWPNSQTVNHVQTCSKIILMDIFYFFYLYFLLNLGDIT